MDQELEQICYQDMLIQGQHQHEVVHCSFDQDSEVKDWAPGCKERD